MVWESPLYAKQRARIHFRIMPVLTNGINLEFASLDMKNDFEVAWSAVMPSMSPCAKTT